MRPNIGLLLLFPLVAAAPAAAQHGLAQHDTSTSDTSLRRAAVNGVELYYRDQGSGAPVIFVHGVLEDYQSWGEAVVDSLARSYRVITYSRRHNYPNRNLLVRGPFSAATEAADLAAFIRALDLGPVHLVGHSFGGLVALFLASRQPELVRSLVLTDPAITAWLPSLPDGTSLHRAFHETLMQELRDGFQKGDRDAVLRATLRYFAGADLFDALSPTDREALARNLPEWEAIAFAADPFADPGREAVRGIQAPVLLVTADATLPLLRPINDEVERLLPRVERVRFARTPHELWQARPEEVRRAAEEFLARQ